MNGLAIFLVVALAATASAQFNWPSTWGFPHAGYDVYGDDWNPHHSLYHPSWLANKWSLLGQSPYDTGLLGCDCHHCCGIHAALWDFQKCNCKCCVQGNCNCACCKASAGLSWHSSFYYPQGRGWTGSWQPFLRHPYGF